MLLLCLVNTSFLEKKTSHIKLWELQRLGQPEMPHHPEVWGVCVYENELLDNSELRMDDSGSRVGVSGSRTVLLSRLRDTMDSMNPLFQRSAPFPESLHPYSCETTAACWDLYCIQFAYFLNNTLFYQLSHQLFHL